MGEPFNNNGGWGYYNHGLGAAGWGAAAVANERWETTDNIPCFLEVNMKCTAEEIDIFSSFGLTTATQIVDFGALGFSEIMSRMTTTKLFTNHGFILVVKVLGIHEANFQLTDLNFYTVNTSTQSTICQYYDELQKRQVWELSQMFQNEIPQEHIDRMITIAKMNRFSVKCIFDMSFFVWRQGIHTGLNQNYRLNGLSIRHRYEVLDNTNNWVLQTPEEPAGKVWWLAQ